jgi:hypothetical protein
MTDKLNKTEVEALTYRVNRLLGVGTAEQGLPINARGVWQVNAIALDNAGYGRWSVCKITKRNGAMTVIQQGTLRECKTFLEGMVSGASKRRTDKPLRTA